MFFKKNLNKSDCKPNKIREDKGSKFYNKSMKSWLQDNDIEKKVKKAGLKRSVKVFCDDYNAIDTSNIFGIHRYTMKETWYKMFEFL